MLSLAPLYDALRERGYAEEGECVLIEGVPVQFLPAYNALLEEASREARETPYEEVCARVVRAEHLIAICLQTGRDKARERVRILREQADLDMNYLARGAPTPRSGRKVEAMEALKPEVAALFAAKKRVVVSWRD